MPCQSLLDLRPCIRGSVSRAAGFTDPNCSRQPCDPPRWPPRRRPWSRTSSTPWPTEGWSCHDSGGTGECGGRRVRTPHRRPRADRRLPGGRGDRARRGGPLLPARRRAGARHRRRVRLRQEHGGRGAAGPPPGHRGTAERYRDGGRDRCGDRVRTGVEAVARVHRGHGLPGPAVLPRPLPGRRRPDRRGVPDARPAGLPARGPRTGGDRTGPGRHPRRGTAVPVPAARVQRRHAPARADRDGARLRAARAGGGRADHRPGRDGAGPDPRPAARAADRYRYGPGAGLP